MQKSKAEFRELLGKAETVFEHLADYEGNARPNGCGKCVDSLLSQSDIVLAIWDGQAPRGR